MSELPLESPPEPARVTERHMLDLLLDRYDKQTSWRMPRYVRADHVPIGLSFGRDRIADFMVMDTQSHARRLGPSNIRDGYERQTAPVFHGFEVKVSRSDWLTELRDPAKSEVFKKHMHFWWLVVSDKDIVREGLPDGWGLLVKSGNGLRVSVQAPLLNPEPMPHGLIGGFMRAAIRTEAGETE